MQNKITYQPIGHIVSEYQTRKNVPQQGQDATQSEAVIVVRQKFVEGIKSISKGDKLVIVFHIHKSTGYELTLIPCVSQSPMGVFSTRTPDRPNPIGITTVEVIKVEDNMIYFSGADMLDETPVLDIKPILK